MACLSSISAEAMAWTCRRIVDTLDESYPTLAAASNVGRLERFGADIAE